MEKRKRRKKGWKEFVRKKRKKGRMRCGRKEESEEERMKENEKEKKKRGTERRIENKESGTRSVPPSPDAFPSSKLGNNMTPKKGRLGKNTTPTSRGPTKLKQNLQEDPRRRRSTFDVHFAQISATHQKEQNIRSINSIAMNPPFIRRIKALGNL